ncbi:MAG: hypothetical protein BWY06_02799 [Candidatus Latescibacteria bacterium ADurb.Bin168]|nr:MAG: hypothetical protein BWY06_02799 [Candidatus Latescibacteria bacterium ADurb.Bin168]
METLKIKAKTENMIQYAYVAFRHMPKSERFTLCADMKRSLFRILELEIRANYAREQERLAMFRDLDIELDVFRSLMRLAKDLEFLPFQKYETLSEHVAEVGRMLGGLIKRAKTGLAQ